MWFPDTSDSPMDEARPQEGANQAMASEGKARAAYADSPKSSANNEPFSPAMLDPFETEAQGLHGLTAKELDKAIVSRALSQALGSPQRWTNAGGTKPTEASEIATTINQSDARLPWIPAFPMSNHGWTENNSEYNSRSRSPREDKIATENSEEWSVAVKDDLERMSNDSYTSERRLDGARPPATLGSESMEITSDLDVPSDQDEGG